MVSDKSVLKYAVESEIVRSNSNGNAIVDELEFSGERVKVYVKGNVEPKSPPQRLTQMMAEHGYRYTSWVMNGKPGDGRAIFSYVPMDDN